MTLSFIDASAPARRFGDDLTRHLNNARNTPRTQRQQVWRPLKTTVRRALHLPRNLIDMRFRSPCVRDCGLQRAPSRELELEAGEEQHPQGYDHRIQPHQPRRDHSS